MTIATSRRAFLGGLIALVAAPAAAHTPYRQWVVYRQKHLMLGCHRDDDVGYALAKAAERHLADHLPAARARVARAPAASRLAGLIATGQLDLCVLDPGTAGAMLSAEGVFAAYGPLPIAPIAPLGSGRALYAHARFEPAHTSLLAEALADFPTVGAPQ